jgi:hypothetical protein
MTERSWAIAAALLLSGAAWFTRSVVRDARAQRLSEAPPAPVHDHEQARADLLARAPPSEPARIASAGSGAAGRAVPRPSLVVRGRVTDREGRPVHGAEVRFLRDRLPGPIGVEVKRLLTDGTGCFEWGASSAGDSIVVKAFGFVPADPVVARGGGERLELVLTRFGWLSAEVVNATEDWPLLVVWRDGQRVPAMTDVVFSGGRRRVELGLLPAGTYSLSYRYPWSAEVGWIHGLRIELGRETRDPRLEPLDLREFLPAIALTIVDPEGRSVPEPAIWLGEHCVDNFVSVHPARDGERWLVFGRPLRIHLEAAGFRMQELAEVVSDQRIVLERGVPVRVRIVGPLPCLPSGWELRGELSLRTFDPSAGRRLGGVNQPSFSLEGGEGGLVVAGPGGYAFSFRITGDVATGLFWDEPPPILEVRDAATQQSFVLDAPSEAMVREMRAYIAKFDGITFSR